MLTTKDINDIIKLKNFYEHYTDVKMISLPKKYFKTLYSYLGHVIHVRNLRHNIGIALFLEDMHEHAEIKRSRNKITITIHHVTTP